MKNRYFIVFAFIITFTMLVIALVTGFLTLIEVYGVLLRIGLPWFMAAFIESMIVVAVGLVFYMVIRKFLGKLKEGSME